MEVRLPNGNQYDGVWYNGNLQRLLSVENKKPKNDKQINCDTD